MPKLSVIVAAYNHKQFVDQMMASILAQSYRDMEIIVIDDGSNDGTFEALETYGSKIVLHRQDNKGVLAARCHGIGLSSGEYLAFIDSDDVIAANRFEKQVAMLDSKPTLGLTYSEAKIIDGENCHLGMFSDIYPPFHRNITRNLFCKYCFMPAITVTFRRSVYEKTGSLWGGGAFCDYLKWIEISAISDVHYDPEPLGFWRRHKSSASLAANVEEIYLSQLEALEKVRQNNSLVKKAVRYGYRKRYSRIYFIIGFFAAIGGELSKARNYFGKAALQFPWAFENTIGFLLSSKPFTAVSPHIFNEIYRYIYKWR